MQYRSIADLSRVVNAGLSSLPEEIDLVVGIPRSGMLAAAMVALQLNLPFMDLASLEHGGKAQQGSSRPARRGARTAEEARRILVVDDSVHSGRAMASVRSRVEQAGLADLAVYCAAIVTEHGRDLVDIWFDVCDSPRMFEWNLMHNDLLANACVDIDGVLCRDPTEDENDDGDRYVEFIESVKPRVQPTFPIGRLVTARLEKYREPTESWLRLHQIEFDELEMLDLPSKEARQAANAHAAFKADIYRSSGALIFIESSAVQSATIAEFTGRPVVCTDNGRLYRRAGKAVVGPGLRRIVGRARELGPSETLKAAASRLKKR